MAERFVIVPCSGAKLEHTAPAAEIYTGSMFRMSLPAARKLAGDTGRVLILSAKHGLLELEQPVAPYDVRMGEPGAVDQPGPIADLADQLAQLDPAGTAELVGLLPNAYRQALENAGRPVLNMFAGCRGIGEQRAVLARINRDELTLEEITA